MGHRGRNRETEREMSVEMKLKESKLRKERERQSHKRVKQEKGWKELCLCKRKNTFYVSRLLASRSTLRKSTMFLSTKAFILLNTWISCGFLPQEVVGSASERRSGRYASSSAPLFDGAPLGAVAGPLLLAVHLPVCLSSLFCISTFYPRRAGKHDLWSCDAHGSSSTFTLWTAAPAWCVHWGAAEGAFDQDLTLLSCNCVELGKKKKLFILQRTLGFFSLFLFRQCFKAEKSLRWRTYDVIKSSRTTIKLTLCSDCFLNTQICLMPLLH